MIPQQIINLKLYGLFEDFFSPEFLNGSFSLVITIGNDEMGDGAPVFAGQQYTNRLSLIIRDIIDRLTDDAAFERELRISFTNELENFDIAIAGILALFNQRFPLVQIGVALPLTSDYEIRARFQDSFSKIRFIYQQLTGKELFKLYNEEGRAAKEPVDPLLIFPIKPDTFYDYFINTESAWDLHELAKGIGVEQLKNYKNKRNAGGKTNADKNFRKVRDFIRNFELQLHWKHNNRSFLQEYLYMLANFDLIAEYVSSADAALAEQLGLARFVKLGFSELGMKQLQDAFRPIWNKMLEQPPFYIYLYCLLVNRNIGTVTISDEKVAGGKIKGKVQVLIDRLNELTTFTQNLFLSIREIARNIIDHTESRRGVLTGRIYHAAVLPGIKDKFINGQNFVETYIHDVAGVGDRYGDNDLFELAVFDEGKIGIVGKTIQNIENILSAASSENENLYRKDIDHLRRGEVKLADFFNTEDIKLHHHAIKTASHWGLIIFSNLVRRNYGFFSSSSNNLEYSDHKDYCSLSFNHSSSTLTLKEPGEYFALGTYYEVILPLNRRHALHGPPAPKIPYKDPGFSAYDYQNLLRYVVVENASVLKSSDKFVLLNIRITERLTDAKGLGYRKELDIAQQVAAFISEQHVFNSHFIPVLDFEGCADHFDQSRLLRFLAYLQLNQQHPNLIICNVKADHIIPMREIIQLGGDHFPDTHFWNANHFVLICSYTLDSEGRRNYYTDLLGGYTFRDLKKLRNKLSATHQSLFEVSGEVNEPFSPQTLAGIKASPLFRNDEAASVHNFELVLKFGNKTYFELSLENTLNRSVYHHDPDNTGYKIDRTHFRLGSKTHISAFIYAKHIFQNSFYSDRFAFLAARYISENHAELKDNPLTLMGYGDYSQLLVNRTTELLRRIWPNTELNNNLFSDIEQLKLLKVTLIHSQVVLIVPINTTFSTAIKLENWIRTAHGATVIIPINLILVTHNNLEDPEYVQGLNNYLATKDRNTEADKLYPYRLFNWKFVDHAKMIAEVETNRPDVRVTRQKYFIPIVSSWSLPENCEACFPGLGAPYTNVLDYRILEKPLLETDKVSVTPDLLLDIPRNFQQIQTDSAYPDGPVFLNEEAHLSGHIFYRHGHYLNFVDPYSFFNAHQDQILAWTKDCREKLLAVDAQIFNKSVLLISSSNNPNAYFIEYINQHIFHGSAIINHYEIGDDYVENFQKFFSSNINQSEYIFFVDDFIHSGNTFHLINDFVRYCHINLAKKGVNHRWMSCSGVFVLINKADNYSQNDILSIINQEGREKHLFFPFFQWKDNYIPVEKCPLCKERNRYLRLSDNSMLDTVKHFFLNKAKNLRLKPYDQHDAQHPSSGWEKFHPLVIETDAFPWSDGSSKQSLEAWATFSKGYFPGKSYLKMLVQHALNELLSDNDEIRNYINGDTLDLEQTLNIALNKELLDLIIKEIKNKKPFADWLATYNATTLAIFDQLFKEVVIKVFTQQPFKNIKPIRERVFAWILIELTERLSTFSQMDTLEFEDFRYIKLLMRRATLLGSNFIIDRKTLDDFREVYKTYMKISEKEITMARNIKLTKTDEEFKAISEHERSIKIVLMEKEAQLGSLEVLLAQEVPQLDKITKEEDIIRRRQREQGLVDLVADIALLKEDIETAGAKKKYLLQFRNNIVYKDISLKEFSYYYVALIKELTLINESKVISIERNIDDLMAKIDRKAESGFYYLLRLIKLENASMINAAAEMIIKHFVNGQFELSLKNHCSNARTVIKKILLNSLEDYRLASFCQFMNIDVNAISGWLETSEANNFIHLIYLLEALRKESEPDRKNETIGSNKIAYVRMENKTESILRNIYRMICDPDFAKHDYESDDPYLNESTGNGAYLAVKYRGQNKSQTDPEDVTISNVYFSGKRQADEKEDIRAKEKKLTEIQIDSDTMSYLMLKGVTAYQQLVKTNTEEKYPVPSLSKNFPLKPWTILELSADSSSEDEPCWSVNRGAVYRATNEAHDRSSIFHQDPKLSQTFIDFYFNEYAAIDNSSHYMAFIRIADIREDIEKNEVINDGKGVIALFTGQNELPLDRLRLILLLNNKLAHFFKMHYEQDSLTAFMEERDRLTEATRLKHGYLTFLQSFQRIALDQTIDADIRDKAINLYYNQLYAGPVLANELVKIRSSDHEQVRKDLAKLFTLRTYSGNNILTQIREVIEIIYSNILDEENPDAIKNFTPTLDEFLLPEGIQFRFFEPILKLLITEMAYNAKKSQVTLKDEEKKIKLWLDYHGSILTISLENNYSSPFSQGEKHRVMKGNFKYSTRGLGLVYRLSDIYGEKPIIHISDNPLLFKITLKIHSYDKEEPNRILSGG